LKKRLLLIQTLHDKTKVGRAIAALLMLSKERIIMKDMNVQENQTVSMEEIDIYKYNWDINDNDRICLRKIPFKPILIYEPNGLGITEIQGYYKSNPDKLVNIRLNEIILGRSLYLLAKDDDYAMHVFKEYNDSLLDVLHKRIQDLADEFIKTREKFSEYSYRIHTVHIFEEN